MFPHFICYCGNVVDNLHFFCGNRVDSLWKAGFHSVPAEDADSEFNKIFYLFFADFTVFHISGFFMHTLSTGLSILFFTVNPLKQRLQITYPHINSPYYYDDDKKINR